LFVPGWCCDHRFFAPQFDYFERTHAVTVMSLRGCGRSSSTADGHEIASLADDVAWFCAEIGIVRPVVIGHSLGSGPGGSNEPTLRREHCCVRLGRVWARHAPHAGPPGTI